VAEALCAAGAAGLPADAWAGLVGARDGSGRTAWDVAVRYDYAAVAEVLRRAAASAAAAVAAASVPSAGAALAARGGSVSPPPPSPPAPPAS
jgi:hypothetical protein